MPIHQSFFGNEKTITLVDFYSTKVSGTSITLNVSSSVQNGDLLVAVVYAGGGSAGDWVQTSFTWAVEQNNANPNLGVAHKVAASEPASYNFTTSSSRDLSGTLMVFRSAVWDQTGTLLTDSNAGDMIATGVTVTKSDSLLVGTWGTNTGAISITTPSGMTAIVDETAGARPGYEIFSEIIASGPSGTRTATVGGSTASSAVLFSLLPV